MVWPLPIVGIDAAALPPMCVKVLVWFCHRQFSGIQVAYLPFFIGTINPSYTVTNTYRSGAPGGNLFLQSPQCLPTIGPSIHVIPMRYR